MAAITDLATLTAIASNDWLVVNDVSAGSDKKITQSDLLGPTGTWTPALNFGGATTGITYTARAGNYVRIGSLVYVNFSIELSSKGSATGNATITGLPVDGGTDYDGVVVRFFTNLASLTGNPFGYIGGTTITLAMASATSRTILADTNFANNSRLDMWGIYTV